MPIMSQTAHPGYGSCFGKPVALVADPQMGMFVISSASPMMGTDRPCPFLITNVNGQEPPANYVSVGAVFYQGVPYILFKDPS